MVTEEEEKCDEEEVTKMGSTTDCSATTNNAATLIIRNNTDSSATTNNRASSNSLSNRVSCRKRNNGDSSATSNNRDSSMTVNVTDLSATNGSTDLLDLSEESEDDSLLTRLKRYRYQEELPSPVGLKGQSAVTRARCPQVVARSPSPPSTPHSIAVTVRLHGVERSRTINTATDTTDTADVAGVGSARGHGNAGRIGGVASGQSVAGISNVDDADNVGERATVAYTDSAHNVAVDAANGAVVGHTGHLDGNQYSIPYGSMYPYYYGYNGCPPCYLPMQCVYTCPGGHGCVRCRGCAGHSPVVVRCKGGYGGVLDSEEEEYFVEDAKVYVCPSDKGTQTCFKKKVRFATDIERKVGIGFDEDSSVDSSDVPILSVNDAVRGDSRDSRRSKGKVKLKGILKGMCTVFLCNGL